MQISSVLRALSDGRYGYWCPGCQMLHVTPFGCSLVDFNTTKPSFTSPIKIGRGRDSTCNHSISDGRITYYADCRHKLKGSTVDLPALPPEYQDVRRG